jgi:hypothetical protein
MSDPAGTEERRPAGIHVVRRSDFRISDFQISLDATTGELVDSSMITELRTDIFDHWLRIAEHASDQSEVARRQALGAQSADAEGFAEALQREFEASLMAITASAFAIDAFFASVVEHAPEARVTAKSRDGTIFETFKRAFSLSHAQLTALRQPLRMLFRLRRDAVHPAADPCAAGRGLTDDRRTGAARRAGDAPGCGQHPGRGRRGLMELQRRVPRAAVTDLISIPSGQRPASSSGSAEAMSRGSA